MINEVLKSPQVSSGLSRKPDPEPLAYLLPVKGVTNLIFEGLLKLGGTLGVKLVFFIIVYSLFPMSGCTGRTQHVEDMCLKDFTLLYLALVPLPGSFTSGLCCLVRLSVRELRRRNGIMVVNNKTIPQKQVCLALA